MAKNKQKVSTSLETTTKKADAPKKLDLSDPRKVERFVSSEFEVSRQYLKKVRKEHPERKNILLEYDDRVTRSKDAPTLLDVANAMNTTPLKVRKLLITAGYYSTQASREVQELHEAGYESKPSERGGRIKNGTRI